jgi:hypothetical protein
MARPRTRSLAHSKTPLPFGAARYKIRYCKLTGLYNVPAALTAKIAARVATHEETHAVDVGVPSNIAIAVSSVCNSCPDEYRERCQSVRFVQLSSLEMERFAARSRGRSKSR